MEKQKQKSISTKKQTCNLWLHFWTKPHIEWYYNSKWTVSTIKWKACNTNIYGTVWWTQSELFFRLLLKNTVCSSPKAVYAYFWKSLRLLSLRIYVRLYYPKPHLELLLLKCVLVMSCVPHSSIMQTLFIQGFEEGGKKESQFWFRSIHEFLYWKIQDSTH